MSQSETAMKKQSLRPAPPSDSLNGPGTSGFVLKPIDVPAAIALLKSFYEEDEHEQRETWELLKQALAEHRP